MENIFGIVFSFLLVISLSFSTGYVKQWNKMSNWHNAANWDKGRLPCIGDTIKLNDGVVFINQNSTMGDLELPLNGEILIGEGSELTFQDPSTVVNNQCQNEDITFLGNKPEEWLNPFNWDLIENGVKSRHTDGMLYTDRVPCKRDKVTFPSNDAFATKINQSVAVSRLQLASGILNNRDARSYFSTPDGRLRFSFVGSGWLEVNELLCLLPQGCPCGTTALKDAICQTFKCPSACPNSVKPDGDCCDRCGALIKMHTEQGFNLAGCQSKLRDIILSAGFKDVLLAISPVDRQSSSEVQILLTDSQGENPQIIGKKIFELLKQQTETTCKGYDVFFFPTEGDTGEKGGGDDNKSTIALAVVLTIVLLAIIIVLIFFVWRRARHGSFSVKRNVLHNEMNIAGVQELDYVESQFDGNNGGQGKGGSYENPVYDEMGYPNGAAAAPIPAKAAATNGVNSIDNPMYEKEILWNVGQASPGGTSVASSRRSLCIPRRSSWMTNINLDDDARSDITAEPGQTNPLYTDLYGEEKPPISDDDYKNLEDSDDETPEMMKAKLKIELEDEDDDDDDDDNGKHKESSEA